MKFSVAAISFQILLLVLFATLAQYDPKESGPVKLGKIQRGDGMSLYPAFQDIHVMIFLGIGFLIIFLKKYGYSAVGYNFFLGALAVQWYIIVAGCLKNRGKTGFDIDLNLNKLITAEFAAAVILISFGVYLGKVSRLQALIICIIEVVMYAVNELIVLEELQAADIGGTMIVHIFACYFGIGLTFVIRKPQDTDNHPKQVSTYHSDLFAMIGTIFLWVYWPSFNSILAHVQNATLAGGVVVGTTANMLIQPWGAILLGILAAVACVLGFEYVQPFLNNTLQLHDTCGVHNLHGMPGLLGALAGVVAAKLADKQDYEDSLEQVFEAAKDGRTSSKQAGYQAIAILVTLAISLVSGAITGFIVKLKIFDPPTRDQFYDDEDFWELPEPSKASVSSEEISLEPITAKPANSGSK